MKRGSSFGGGKPETARTREHDKLTIELKPVNIFAEKKLSYVPNARSGKNTILVTDNNNNASNITQ